MGAVTAALRPVLRALGLDDERWEKLTANSVWGAAALVFVAAAFMSLNRFGGLAADAPRAFTRLALYVVWGWLGLALATFAVAELLRRRGRGRSQRADPGALRLTLASTGYAHVPIVALAGVIFVAAGLFQALGPGLVAAVIALAVWMPVALVTGVGHVHGLRTRHAVAAVAAPYLLWLWIVARHVLGQVTHLL